MKPIIAISMGDYNGIGPEIILKALNKTDLNQSIPVIIGNYSVINAYSRLLNFNLPVKPINDFRSVESGNIYLYNIFPGFDLPVNPGKITAEAGGAAMEAVDFGVKCCMESKCHALVTAPISKEAISLAGYTVPGHTEFLAEKTSAKKYMMILASDVMKVGLATIHIPLKEVAGSINRESLTEQIYLLNDSLISDFSIKEPIIAVLGLNPHAGDGGVLGREEIEIIEPVVKRLSQNGIKAEGPFAADGFFGSRLHENFDAILAMYHDQGLIPFKTLSFGKGVNFTAGLPIIRTSPDHGTAFNIAGKNQADEQSFIQAYKLAAEMAAKGMKQNSR
jgi:4-hydroxythreonine-4-phosphate dehydrogenase